MSSHATSLLNLSVSVRKFYNHIRGIRSSASLSAVNMYGVSLQTNIQRLLLSGDWFMIVEMKQGSNKVKSTFEASEMKPGPEVIKLFFYAQLS